MKAFVITETVDLNSERNSLKEVDLPKPTINDDEILIKVSCCGVCHTELDEIEGRTPPSHLPMVPGHEVVGIIEKCGNKVNAFKPGDRVGVAWIFSSCGICEYCKSGLENLCPAFKGTGRDENGGYAEFMHVPAESAYLIPDVFSDEEAAPLMCAGAIGYRSLYLTGLENGQTLGLMGFGASGHLVLKMVKKLMPDTEVLVFTRNLEEQNFAKSIGAKWAGEIEDNPPFLLNAMIDTTPVWKTMVQSLLYLKPGGRLVINAIRKEHMDQSALQGIVYEKHLWMEKEIKSVANITHNDVKKFLEFAGRVSLKSVVQKYPFERANEAIWDLKHKNVKGGKVLVW
ncbi:zinc-dependent alcohol dehydrogenase family protein [Echinicola shivajiensis]|uniref:zinc-dependent alcohol dehydrogenase family protein n=1 Tax=Echinicola shivajiensis TaxID=1035916 RepID=UPI001BFC556A|nr:zinc-dependent alcohol dehydrogenase family protein [Echinicola shivajiensis]